MNSAEPISFRQFFEQATTGSEVPKNLVQQVFDQILEGSWTPAQVAGLMVCLRMRGESAGVISAAAQALRGAMIGVTHGFEKVLDTCGTGGDGRGSLNLSTGAAIIAAGCGAIVAKHGNRAVSSRAGSADVLGALGIPLDLPASAASKVLEQAHIAFLLAPVHHPAMRHAAVARKELGIRSLFNCLGPLANPARATHQLIGAYDDALRSILAETLRELGTRRAWVVRSEDGFDEVSPFATTVATELSDGHIRELRVTPEDFGLKRSASGAIDGGDAEHNAQVLKQVLSGKPHPSRDAFILNAAAALVVLDGGEPRQAAKRASEALDSGAALGTLERWKATALSAKAS